MTLTVICIRADISIPFTRKAGKQVLKIARPLHDCSELQLRNAARVLLNEGSRPIEISCRVVQEYCENSTKVYEWSEKFNLGIISS